MRRSPTSSAWRPARNMPKPAGSRSAPALGSRAGPGRPPSASDAGISAGRWRLGTRCNILCRVEAAEARAPSDPELDPERDLAGALHEVSNALTVVLGCLETAQGRASVAGLREAIDIARAHARLGYCVARRAIGAPLVDQEAEATALRVARETVIGVTPHA